MSIITQEYKQQIQQMQDPFNRGSAMLYKLEDFLKTYNPKSLIDFGCSQGGLHKELGNTIPVVAGYDPGVPEFENLPTTTFETLVSIDVLEHVEPATINQTLQVIDKLFTKACYLLIASYPAKKFLPDGRNAHLIIENIDWWEDKIKSNIQGSIVSSTQVVVENKTKKGPSRPGNEFIFVIEKI